MPTALMRLGVAVLLAAGIACGKSDDGSTPTSPSASSPGTITVTSSAIVNQNGKVFVVAAIPEGQSIPIGRACVPITSNAFVAPPTVLVEIATSNNPCDPASVIKTFPAGRYSVTSGVFVSGSTTPERVTAQTVQVAGSVSASVNGTLLSQ